MASHSHVTVDVPFIILITTWSSSSDGLKELEEVSISLTVISDISHAKRDCDHIMALQSHYVLCSPSKHFRQFGLLIL